MWRARKPKSWWVTPEVRQLADIHYTLALRLWQAGGGKGSKPARPKFPEDREAKVKSTQQLASKRRSGSTHLKQRRAQMQADKAKKERR